MALASGTKLGPYEIQLPLGAGGMGEVYRARDTRLGREVAIKVLPSAFSLDPERLRRFKQEAQVVAALNHPNILAIHDFGEHEGSPYIVTELLEGQTLRGSLSGGPIPSRKATNTAEQVARGLAAAHHKGIVHRDLKPENIFITRGGRVKILDFGLAKLTPDKTPDAETVASQTEPGVVMGTMGYMSPEQVRGLGADHRSDLFSLGAVLYEMLSGKRAFHGETSVDVASAILHSEPPELTETNQKVSPALSRIVGHCLEKSPEARFQSAHDLVFDLEAASETSASHPVTPPSRSGRLSRLSIGILVALVVLAGLVALIFFVGHQRLARARPPALHQITFRRGTIWNARFAPDGKSVLYGAAWEGNPVEIFHSSLDSPDARPLGLTGADVLSVLRKERWRSYCDASATRDSVSPACWPACPWPEAHHGKSSTAWNQPTRPPTARWRLLTTPKGRRVWSFPLAHSASNRPPTSGMFEFPQRAIWWPLWNTMIRSATTV